MLINILFEFLLYFQPFFLKQSFFLRFFFGYNQSKPYICVVHNKDGSCETSFRIVQLSLVQFLCCDTPAESVQREYLFYTKSKRRKIYLLTNSELNDVKKQQEKRLKYDYKLHKNSSRNIYQFMSLQTQTPLRMRLNIFYKLCRIAARARLQKIK